MIAIKAFARFLAEFDRIMDVDTLLKHDCRAPRYTSYPTAAQFTAEIGPDACADWLARLETAAPVSLYAHVPFCHSLCWYCGCNMQVVRRRRSTDAYADLLRREIDLVAERLPARLAVGQIHWGGGTPMTLGADRLIAVVDRLRARFEIGADAVMALEVDPRIARPADILDLRPIGLTHASIGVQDFDPEVQRAINRVQSVETTRRAVALLRDIGVRDINFDLIYGLPGQTEAVFARTIARAHRLGPDRIALFGYAHVPWMKRHQRLIDASRLPDAAARLRLFALAEDMLRGLGYDRVGIDHFARPDSELAVAARRGRLRRNFQGYTSDTCDTVLGFGASAIGGLPGGFVQNATAARDYRDRIAEGALATVRGVARSADDRLRGEVIERLMCDFEVDLNAVCQAHGTTPGALEFDGARLDAFRTDGLVATDGNDLRITTAGRPLARAIASVFDAHLAPDAVRHSRAV